MHKYVVSVVSIPLKWCTVVVWLSARAAMEAAEAAVVAEPTNQKALDKLLQAQATFEAVGGLTQDRVVAQVPPRSHVQGCLVFCVGVMSFCAVCYRRCVSQLPLRLVTVTLTTMAHRPPVQMLRLESTAVLLEQIQCIKYSAREKLRRVPKPRCCDGRVVARCTGRAYVACCRRDSQVAPLRAGFHSRGL